MKKLVLIVSLLSGSLLSMGHNTMRASVVNPCALELPLPIPVLRDEMMVGRLHMMLAEKAIRMSKAQKARAKCEVACQSQVQLAWGINRFTIRTYRRSS